MSPTPEMKKTTEEIALRIMSASETEDSNHPYRVLLAGDPEWIKNKMLKIKAALDQYAQKVEEVEKKLICSFCGGTDLVCGKGHIESTNALKRQITLLQTVIGEKDKALMSVRTMAEIGFNTPGEATHFMNNIFDKCHAALALSPESVEKLGSK